MLISNNKSIVTKASVVPKYKNTPYKIYDNSGREFLNGNHADEIDISGLKPGIYFISLHTEKNIHTKRFIVR